MICGAVLFPVFPVCFPTDAKVNGRYRYRRSFSLRKKYGMIPGIRLQIKVEKIFKKETNFY